MRLVLMHLLRRSHIIIFLLRLDPKRPTPRYKITIFTNYTSVLINLKFDLPCGSVLWTWAQYLITVYKEHSTLICATTIRAWTMLNPG